MGGEGNVKGRHGVKDQRTGRRVQNGGCGYAFIIPFREIRVAGI